MRCVYRKCPQVVLLKKGSFFKHVIHKKMCSRFPFYGMGLWSIFFFLIHFSWITLVATNWTKLFVKALIWNILMKGSFILPLLT